MSGSGGFSRYRCKYFSTHSCEQWVWVKNSACAYCVAAGRDDDPLPAEQPLNIPQQVLFPVVRGGRIIYTIMQVMPTVHARDYWALRNKTTQQPLMPTITTSDTPGTAVATVGMGAPQAYHN